MRWNWWPLALAACAAPQQQYAYRGPDNGPERELQPVTARAVPAAEAEASGLAGEVVAMPFSAPADGTQLVSDFLAREDQAHATYVADLAIYLETTQDGRRVECRSDVVPEVLTETVRRPEHFELVSVQRPVQRTVTDYEYHCKPVMKQESRMHTEYEQQCGSVSRPVQRSRTVYRSQYDSFELAPVCYAVEDGAPGAMPRNRIEGTVFIDR